MAEPILTLDKYNLLEVLGRGGMATVYKARMNGPMGFEKLAAVKLLHTELGAEKDIVGMFIDEARVGAHLSHPNVIGILDFGMIDNRYYLAMEYVDGCNLANLVKPGSGAAGKSMPVEAAVCAIVDVLDGLAYVHTARDPNGASLGIVHRDISPQNIMVGRDGRARIGDFGIATGDFRESFTHAGVVKGKVAYMSPEQAAGKSLDARSDIAATGLTLFALISGRIPFQGNDTMAILARAEQGLKAEALDEIKCPPALKEVILKATAPKMQDRYQKAAEFKAALEASTTGWDGLGRSLLQKMVAAATRPRKAGAGRSAKQTPLSTPIRKVRTRLTTRDSSTAPEPVTRMTLLAYRIGASVVVATMIVAVIMAMYPRG